MRKSSKTKLAVEILVDEARKNLVRDWLLQTFKGGHSVLKSARWVFA